VARQLVLDDVLLLQDHLGDAPDELLHGGTDARAPVAVAPGGPEAPHRLAEGLRRDRPRLDADPAHGALLLDHGHALAPLRRLHRATLARGPASDADEVVVVRGFHGSPRESEG